MRRYYRPLLLSAIALIAIGQPIYVMIGNLGFNIPVSRWQVLLMSGVQLLWSISVILMYLSIQSLTRAVKRWRSIAEKWQKLAESSRYPLQPPSDN